MRILYLGINYWPDDTGIAPFNAIRCEYLAARGHDITALTGFPYYPQWRIPPEYRRRVHVREQRRGVNLIRSWLYVPRQVTSLTRVVHEASFSLSALINAFSLRRPDAILVVSPPLPLTITGSILSRIWGVPYILQVEDLQPDAAVDLGMLRNRLVIKALYGVERKAYRSAALVITLNDEMAGRIISKGIDPDHVAVIPHGVDSSLFGVRSTGDGAKFRRTHRLEGKFVIVHAGNMGIKQGLEVILGTAALARAIPEIVFLLVGDGATRASLEQRAAKLSLRNVRFFPQLPRADFHDLLAAADLSLVTQRRSVSDILFPSKVETLMAAGQPIAASVSTASAVAKVLQNSNAGQVVEPENAGALLDAILSLQGDPTRRATMRRCGQAYAQKHWSREQALAAMELALTKLCSKRKEITVGAGNHGSGNSGDAAIGRFLSQRRSMSMFVRNRYTPKPEGKDEAIRP